MRSVKNGCFVANTFSLRFTRLCGALASHASLGGRAENAFGSESRKGNVEGGVLSMRGCWYFSAFAFFIAVLGIAFIQCKNITLPYSFSFPSVVCDQVMVFQAANYDE